MKKNILTAALLVSSVLWMSCNNDTTKSETVTPEVNNTMTASEGAVEEAAATIATTKVEIDQPTFDFGKVKEGGKVTHTFKIKNVGDQPYLISKAEPSCGCTVPSFSTKPVLPGEYATIDIEFDTNGRKGPNTKSVNVTSNAEEPIILTFKAEVE